MESNDVALSNLGVNKTLEVLAPVPWTRGDWLGWGCFSGPFEGILKKRKSSSNVPAVSWFIVDIPKIDSLVVFKASNDINEIVVVS